MYNRLNVQDIIKGHKATLKGGRNYRREFVLIPWIIAISLILIKVPDTDVKNIFGICLSILIGLYLNILVLLISSISSENLFISASHKKVRLKLLEETLYSVSYSVYISIKALIVLFLSSILFWTYEPINELFLIFFNTEINYCIQFGFGFMLYLYTINIFLVLFIILKRINVLFIKEINLEELRLNTLLEKEDNDDNNVD